MSHPGASPGGWAHFADMLGLGQDLLPVVSRVDAPISPQSKMKALGKTPSRYNASGQVTGIPHWTAIRASDAQITQWSLNHDYGICLQTRTVRAIDLDVDDLATVGKIRARVAQMLGVFLPARARPGSGRVVLGCIVLGEQSKRVVRLRAGGVVEYLADGQQFIVAGNHIDSRTGRSGGRYFWEGGLPAEFPVVDADLLARVLDAIEHEFGAAGDVGRVERPGVGRDRARVHRVVAGGQESRADDAALWLVSRGFTRAAERGRAGELLIHCPFELEHTSDSGETETVYYPAGTGGYLAGHFKCLHAHCVHRTDADFLDAIGWRFNVEDELELIDDDESMADGPRTGVRRGGAVLGGGLAVVPHGTDTRAQSSPQAPRAGAGPHPGGASADRESAAAPTLKLPEHPTDAWLAGGGSTPGLALTRTVGTAKKPSRFEATINNVVAALTTLGYWRRIGFDEFRDEVMWCEWPDWARGDAQWRPWTDNDYTTARLQLGKDGFEPVSKELVRDAVYLVAEQALFDSAQTWLSRLVWDGTPRVDAFMARYCHSSDDDYSRAVSRYLWTALAARVIVPGTKADMIPILVGEGGARKTTLIETLPPDPDFAARVDFDDEDDKKARKMRGRLAVEFAELRGLQSRTAEAVKDFVTGRYDDIRPLYKEKTRRVWRRCVFFGTTDNEEFLSDAVGNYRRWLPIRVDDIDIDGVAAAREQLWAEGASLYAAGGVAWAEAELLGRLEHSEFVIGDGWSELVANWVGSDWSAHEAGDLSQAGGPDGPQMVSWALAGFTAREALMLGVGSQPSGVNRSTEMRMAKVLRSMGFERVRGTRERGFTKRLWVAQII